MYLFFQVMFKYCPHFLNYHFPKNKTLVHCCQGQREIVESKYELFFVLPRFVHTFPRRTKTTARNSLHYGDDDKVALPLIQATFEQRLLYYWPSQRGPSGHWDLHHLPLESSTACWGLSFLSSHFCCPSSVRRNENDDYLVWFPAARHLVEKKKLTNGSWKKQVPAGYRRDNWPLKCWLCLFRWTDGLQRDHMLPVKTFLVTQHIEPFLLERAGAPLNNLCFDVIRLSPGENPKYCVGFGGLVGAQKQVCDITEPIIIQSQSNLERTTECCFQSLFLSVNNLFWWH